MLLVKSLRSLSVSDSSSRIVYFLGFILWSAIVYYDDQAERKLNGTFMQLPDLALWAIPSSVLLFQVFFNSRVVWLILFVLMVAVFAFSLWVSVSVLQQHGPTRALLAFILVIGGLCLLAYCIRPGKQPKVAADN